MTDRGQEARDARRALHARWRAACASAGARSAASGPDYYNGPRCDCGYPKPAEGEDHQYDPEEAAIHRAALESTRRLSEQVAAETQAGLYDTKQRDLLTH